MWLQVLLFNTNYFIQHHSFVHSQIVPSIPIKYQLIDFGTQLDFKYCYIVSKVGDHSRGLPEGSLFDRYYTEL